MKKSSSYMSMGSEALPLLPLSTSSREEDAHAHSHGHVHGHVHAVSVGVGGSYADKLSELSEPDRPERQHSKGAALDRTGSCSGSSSLLSGGMYTATSAALILLNKKVLSSYHFSAVNTLVCFHCALAVLLVKLCAWLGYVRLEPIRRDLIKIWMPINLIFVSMLVTGFYALQSVGVGMFTILKNLANLFTIVGDYVIFGRVYSWHVWLCLVLMVGSVISGGVTDVMFSLNGYIWQVVNCVFTSAYALYLSGISEKVAVHTADKKRMNEFSMVYYNNLLSIPLLVILAIAFGEWPGVLHNPVLRQPSFIVYATLGGLLGFMISFTSMWFVSQTTATFYSLTGSMNKVVVAVVGMLAFNEPREPNNLVSIAVGLVAGSLLPFAKTRPTVTK